MNFDFTKTQNLKEFGIYLGQMMFEPLSNTDLFIVGDSTLCSFDDSTYFYPRYGYGTQRRFNRNFAK